MLNHILAFSIRQRWLVLALAVGLVVRGIWDFTRLPIDAVPDITNEQVQINTAVTGLSPVEIEKQITFPIEWAMQGIPGVEQVRSISFYGVSQVTVIFQDGTDIYRARQLVAERLAEAREGLPAGAATPLLGPIWTGLGEIYFWSVDAVGPKPDGTPYSPMDLRTLQEWVIKPQLRGVPGVTEINTIGGHVKQYHVKPDPMKLVAYGIGFRDVLEAVAANNADVGGGYIEHRGEQYTIRSTGRIRDLEDIRNIRLGTHDGVPFHLGDVADVAVGHELRTGVGTANGREAVVGTAILLYGENSRTVSQRVDARIEQARKSLPENVRITTLYDRTRLVDAVLNTVRNNLLEGALLVIGVLFLLLGNVRAAIIVAMAIPLSMLFAIVGMVENRISGNLMSLGAIDFGLIVDGTVVMVENVVRRLARRQRELGRILTRTERFDLIRDAAAEVRRPALFGEMITAIVFLPVLALGGVEGKMFRPMAQVLLLALAGSMVLTFTVMPALIALLMTRRIAEREVFLIRWAKTAYARILHAVLRFRAAVVVGAAAVLAVAGLLATRLGSEFIPRLDEEAIALQPARMPSISLSASADMQMKVEQLLLREFPDEIECIFARTGTSEVVTDVCGPEVSDTYITLKPREQWRRARTQQELVAAMEQAVRQLPGQNYEFSQPIELRMNELVSGVRSDVAVKIYGDDLETMLRYAGDVAATLADIPGAADIRTEQVAGMPMLTIDVDRSAAARYGLNVRDVQDVVEIALAGASAGHVLEGDRRFELVVRMPETLRANLDAIRNLPVPLPRLGEGREEARHYTGEPGPARVGYVPLTAVAKVEVVEDARQIRREDGKRRVVVQCNVRGRDLGGFVADAQARVERRLGRLPEGYWLGWGGQFEHLIAARRRLAVAVPLALGLILLLLIASLRSVQLALLVFTGVPLALTGGVLSLWLRGMPFSIAAGVGFIALSGVAVLNGLVMVTFIDGLRRQGRPLREAILEGSLTRLRPVLMTALVAAFGFVPMALATRTGAEVQRPLATVVIGGIISSTLLTLIVLPVIYGWFAPNRPGEESQPLPSPAA